VKPTRDAYTLFELLLVLAMLVILGAVVLPSLDSMYGDYKLTAAADAVRAAWAQGRVEAMESGQAYRFAVVQGQGNFRLAPDRADFWSGSGAPPPGDAETKPPIVLESTLPSGIRFGAVDNIQGPVDQSAAEIPVGQVDSSSWSRVVVFLPNGTTQENVEIAFLGRNLRPLALRLRALTGAVTTEFLQQ
jgi:hypothetical protein